MGKQVECRTLSTKLNSMEKEFSRYKGWSKGETEKYEKTIEELEQKLGEGRRSAESWKRKHDSVQSDLESGIKEKYSLQEQIEHLNDEIANLKENQAEEITQQQNEKTKLEQKLREANHKIKNLEQEKVDLQRKSNNEIEDLSSKITALKSDLKKSSFEKDNLVKKIERIKSLKKREKLVILRMLLRLGSVNSKVILIKKLRKGLKFNKMNSEIDKVKTEISTKQN